VEIVYQLEPDRLVVEVGDMGSGFEPGKLPPSDEAHLEEGGLGIEIIRALADEVEIGPRGDGGFRLRFVKMLAYRYARTPQPPPPPLTMLQLVNVGQKSLADYATIATRGLMDEIRRLAEPLAGNAVVHLAATRV